MIVIYGKGKFGQATIKCCQNMGIEHVMMDDTDRDDIILQSASQIIITPGISPQHAIYQQFGDKITGDLDFWYQELSSRGRIHNFQFIGITGTDGKSSTCWILSQLLQQLKTNNHIDQEVWLAGNFDRPLGDIIHEIIGTNQINKKHIIVLEISSFMAHNLHHMIFDYSIFTNFKKDHLNRHSDMKDYFGAKAHVIQQTKTLTVINQDIIDSEYYHHIGQLSCRVSPIAQDAHYESQFTGAHNMQNIDASYQVARDIVHKLGGTSDDIILSSIIQIPTLHHRIELIGRTIDGIAVYDDGKSTTAQSLGAAIKSFTKVVLIAGGSDKGDDFSVLQSQFSEHVGAGVFLGQTKHQFAQLCDTAQIPYLCVDSMQDAVEQSLSMARLHRIPIILFSPGCASFDMFINREDRVNQFLHHIHPHITGTI